MYIYTSYIEGVSIGHPLDPKLIGRPLRFLKVWETLVEGSWATFIDTRWNHPINTGGSGRSVVPAACHRGSPGESHHDGGRILCKHATTLEHFQEFTRNLHEHPTKLEHFQQFTTNTTHIHNIFPPSPLAWLDLQPWERERVHHQRW